MSDVKTVADVLDELSAALMAAATSGRAHEMIDELVVASERARDEIAMIVAASRG